MSFWESLWMGISGKIRRFVQKKEEKEEEIRDWLDMDLDLEDMEDWAVGSAGGLSSAPERVRR